MDAIAYGELSDLALLEVCVWREARGEPFDGKRAVAHVIHNRVKQGGWWGNDWQSVILKPWQFSSFNESDPNSKKWPSDFDASFAECCQAAVPVYNESDPDITEGAQFYHDTSMGWPKAWGNPSEYKNTLNVGRLKFYRLEPPNTHDAVQDAVTGL